MPARVFSWFNLRENKGGRNQRCDGPRLRDRPTWRVEDHAGIQLTYWAGGSSAEMRVIRDFTNGRGSDVDGPIRHAKPDRRTHTQEVPHTRAVPHRPDIHQPPLAAALQ
jgi:hypothetical protein